MMSDNDIRKEFQSKLNGFEAPVPANGWESVERSLTQAVAARKALRRRWYAGSAAAVLVLLIGSLLFIRNPMEQNRIMVSETTAPPPVSVTTPGTVAETASESDTNSESVAPPAKSGLGQTVKNAKEPNIRPAAPAGILSAWMERIALQTKRVERRADADALHRLAASVKENAGQREKELRTEEIIVIDGDDRPIFAVGRAGKDGERPLLLALGGKGGLTGYQQTVNTPMTLRSASATPENKYFSEEPQKMQAQVNNTTENVSNMEHDQPVSIGITVSKYLFDDLSVETGIVYSYLQSKTRNANNNFKEDEVQKLHYLGIPLNINYNIFSVERLNVYASIGGMVEKDVYGEFRRLKEGQTVNFDNISDESEEMEISKISQRNPQFSVNAGVGLSYPVFNGLRIYGKIGGAYYFDAKNEYKTIYSDGKIVMDLNVGLRYEF